MYVLYTDNYILEGTDIKETEKAIEYIKAAKLVITIKCDIQDFLGVNIDQKIYGTIHLTQPHLVDQTLDDLKMGEDVTQKPTTDTSSKVFSRHSNSRDFDNSFNYQSVIGKLNYMDKVSRSDIVYITHQCARFSTCTKKEHTKEILWLARYRKVTNDKGTILRPVKERGQEMYVDADFAGNWDAK